MALFDSYLENRKIPDTNIYCIGFDGAVSIGDQIRKGVALIYAGRKAQLLTRSARILVLGAGASGIASAVRARKFCGGTIIIDRNPGLLSVLEPVTTRHIHPHEYLWPFKGHNVPRFPDPSSIRYRLIPPPLHWNAGRASTIAQNFASRFEALEPPIGLQQETLLIDEDAVKAMRALNARGKYEMIVFALGGRENRHAKKGKFKSLKYWSRDPIPNERCGISHVRRLPIKMLISGRGDGALQDFLRCTLTCTETWSASHTLSELKRKAQMPTLFLAIESSYPRTKANCRPNSNTLRTTYQEIIRTIVAATPGNQLLNAIESLVHREILDGEREVELSMSGAAFKDVYALNALLVCLVEWYFETKYSAIGVPNPVRISIRGHVQKITSIDFRHRCTGSAHDCYGYAHSVSFMGGDRDTYHGILLRHGVDDLAEKIKQEFEARARESWLGATARIAWFWIRRIVSQIRT